MRVTLTTSNQWQDGMVEALTCGLLQRRFVTCGADGCLDEPHRRWLHLQKPIGRTVQLGTNCTCSCIVDVSCSPPEQRGAAVQFHMSRGSKIDPVRFMPVPGGPLAAARPFGLQLAFQCRKFQDNARITNMGALTAHCDDKASGKQHKLP